MKKSIKRLLLGIAVSATAAFAVVASGCSATDKVETFFIQLTCEHKNKEVVAAIDPTCTEDGYTEHEHCLDCGKDIKKVVIEATGHTLETIVGYKATCTTMGLSDGAYCTVCEETVTEQKNIPALGHKKVVSKAVKATCTTDGYEAGVMCENGCGTVYEGCEIIPATGHEYDGQFCVYCGSGKTLKLSEIEEGMDLSLYAARLTVSKEEFKEKFVSQVDGRYVVTVCYNAGGYFDLIFSDVVSGGYDRLEVDNILCGCFYTGTTYSRLNMITLDSETGEITETGFTLGRQFSSVKGDWGFVGDDPESNEILSYIELYYVGKVVQ